MRLPESRAQAGLLARNNGGLIDPLILEPGNTMKLSTIVGLASLAALALCPSFCAHAQTPGVGIPLNQEEAKSPEQIEKQKAIEDAYKATIKKMPNAKQVDPWGNMRSAEPTQAKARTAPKKANNAAN
jgi:hypothetical protein